LSDELVGGQHRLLELVAAAVCRVEIQCRANRAPATKAESRQRDFLA
jgi:hypothetical protein